jgi:predicted ATPase
LDEALHLVEKTGEGLWAAELYRLRGERVLRDRGQGETWQRAADDFRQALHIAQIQRARSLELRAAISLARLETQRGHQPAESLQTLDRVCRQFTEGLQTTEMQEALALIQASA